MLWGREINRKRGGRGTGIIKRGHDSKGETNRDKKSR